MQYRRVISTSKTGLKCEGVLPLFCYRRFQNCAQYCRIGTYSITLLTISSFLYHDLKVYGFHMSGSFYFPFSCFYALELSFFSVKFFLFFPSSPYTNDDDDNQFLEISNFRSTTKFFCIKSLIHDPAAQRVRNISKSPFIHSAYNQMRYKRQNF